MTRQPLWTRQFVLISLINLTLFFGFQMLLPILPVYLKGLGAADGTIGWVTGLFTLSAIFIRPITGIALDKFGRRGIFFAGLIVFVLVTIAYSWTASIALLLTFRFIHGFGWGASSTASTTVASDIIPKSRFGEGMGFFTLASNVAMALAPVAGLFLISNYSFGLATYVSASLIAFTLVLALFVRYRPLEDIEPAKDFQLFETTAITPSILMFFTTISFGAINSFLALYAMERGIVNIGVFFLVSAAAMALSRPSFGTLVDRKGVGVAVVPGLILVIVSMIVLSQATTLMGFIGAALIFGVGFGGTQASLQTMALIFAPAHRLGLANATFFTGFDSGIAIGSIAMGMIAARIGYGPMFLWSGLSSVIALVLYLGVSRKKREA